MPITIDHSIDKLTSSIGTITTGSNLVVKGEDVSSALNQAQANANAAFIAANLAFTVANTANTYVNTLVETDMDTDTFVIGAGTGSQPNITTLADTKTLLGVPAVDTFAGSAYSKANTGIILAQAAFDQANSAATGSGLPPGGNVGEVVINTSSGNGSWHALTTDDISGLVQTDMNANTFIVGAGAGITPTILSLSNTKTLLGITTVDIAPAYNQANTATVLAQASFTSGNSTSTLATNADNAAIAGFIVANNALNLAQSAYGRANTLDGIGSLTITATQGVAVFGSSTGSLSSNGTLALTANAATTSAVGVVQLNNTTSSTSATQAATPSAVNAVMVMAQAAFAKANTGGGGSSTPNTSNYTIINTVNGADATPIINAALNSALPNTTLYIPQGNYVMSANIGPAPVSGLTILAKGVILNANNSNGANFWLTNGMTVDGLTIKVTNPGTRDGQAFYGKTPFIAAGDSAAQGNAANTCFANNISLLNCTSIGGENGAFFYGVNGFKVVNFTVRDTTADGFHMTHGTANGFIHGYNSANTGDDGLAFISYAGDNGGPSGNGLVQNIVASDITIYDSQANGIDVGGATNISIQGFKIANTVASGIYVNHDDSFGVQNTSNILIDGGTIDNANWPYWSGQLQTASIFLYNGITGTTIRNATIKNVVSTDGAGVVVITNAGQGNSGPGFANCVLQNVTLAGNYQSLYGYYPYAYSAANESWGYPFVSDWSGGVSTQNTDGSWYCPGLPSAQVAFINCTTRGNYGTPQQSSWSNTTIVSDISATGKTQATSLQLTGFINIVTGCIAGSNSVMLPVVGNGHDVTIYNQGTTNLRVYPPTNGNIDSLAQNANTSLAPNQTGVYTQINYNPGYATKSAVPQINDTVTTRDPLQVASANALYNTATLAQAAYTRANTLDGIGSIIVTATSGIKVGTGSTQTFTANGTIALTANTATTAVVGVVQLNDTWTSTSTTLAATANAANAIFTKTAPSQWTLSWEGTGNAPVAQDYHFTWHAPYACRILGAYAQTTSGTFSANFKIGSTSITGLSSISASSTSTSLTSATAANIVAAGNAVLVTISSPSTPVDAMVSLNVIRI